MKITTKELKTGFKPITVEVTFENEGDLSLWRNGLVSPVIEWDRIKVNQEYSYPINLITRQLKSELGE